MPATQASTKYIVNNIVLILTRPCYFTVLTLLRNIFGHRFAERAPETLI